MEILDAYCDIFKKILHIFMALQCIPTLHT